MRKTTCLKLEICLYIFIVLFLTQNVDATSPSYTYGDAIYCDYWDTKFDAAGYTDEMNWGNSPYHPHSYHELLSGEWGAAIYYDGIATGSKAMWLTDKFRVPDWPTNSIFQIDTWPSYWNDPCNPVDGNDTGRSVIKNSQVKVTIDYEVVDIHQVGWWSPLTYREPNDANVSISRSERYVFLQTYTIKNIKTSGNITNLEFYQMLHSHGDDDYGPVVHCSYNDTDVNDPLKNYVPYNPVHTVGNFRYDITQWNNPDDPQDHMDWVGFSSTIEPDVFECGYYAGHDEEPPTGTHIDIENRDLNDANYTYGETAGALGWYLPALTPGQSTSITVAFMFGTTNWPFPTILTKANADPNKDCVRPFIGMGIEDNYLTYDVRYDANGYALSDVVITDRLPLEADYYSSDPCGVYDSNARTVTWDIGSLPQNGSGCIELVTKVNHYARPGGKFTNEVKMECSEGICAEAATDVNVCYYGLDIIYVDKDANGFNNGTNWNDAYKDLRDAFTGAKNGGSAVTAIWVAAGTYKPTYDINESGYTSKSFELLENVGVFGHFGGIGTYETDTSQRNFADANNETILDGRIGVSDQQCVYNVVRAADANSSLLDGFTVKGAYSGRGALLDNSGLSIVNCRFKDNSYGIKADSGSHPDIHNCIFLDNSTEAVYSNASEPHISYCILDGNNASYCGLYLTNNSVSNITNSIFKNHNENAIEGWPATIDVERTIIENNAQNGIRLSSYSNLDIKSSIIRKSGDHGIYLSQNSDTEIINCWIHNNGDSSNGSGIYLENQSGVPIVRNNTIYANYAYGIRCSQTGADPNILNCIIAGNGSGDFYRVSGSFNKVNYCLLQNAHSGRGNRTGSPGFMNITTDPNDLHISEASQCKDTGDPNGSYPGETDIDGENRICYGRVDIGADEYYWSKADYNEDGIVNFLDYCTFANAWMTTNAQVSLDGDNDVDFIDLKLFCDDWLWEKAWDSGWMMMGLGGGGLESMSLMQSSLNLDSAEVISPAKASDSLMLSAAESLRTRPGRLTAKSRKFYNITPEAVIKSKTVLPAPLTKREFIKLRTELFESFGKIWLNNNLEDTELIELRTELLELLDKIWLSNLKGIMTEQEYLEFRQAVESTLQ